MLSDNIRRILRTAKSKKASDVHICVGTPVTCRIDKMIERLLSYALASDENSVRYSLADCLQGAIHLLEEGAISEEVANGVLTNYGGSSQ